MGLLTGKVCLNTNKEMIIIFQASRALYSRLRTLQSFPVSVGSEPGGRGVLQSCPQQSGPNCQGRREARHPLPQPRPRHARHGGLGGDQSQSWATVSPTGAETSHLQILETQTQTSDHGGPTVQPAV